MRVYMLSKGCLPYLRPFIYSRQVAVQGFRAQKGKYVLTLYVSIDMGRTIYPTSYNRSWQVGLQDCIRMQLHMPPCTSKGRSRACRQVLQARVQDCFHYGNIPTWKYKSLCQHLLTTGLASVMLVLQGYGLDWKGIAYASRVATLVSTLKKDRAIQTGQK